MARSRVLLPTPDGPVISTGSPGLGAERRVVAQRRAVRQVEIEGVDRDPGAVALDLDRLRALRAAAAIASHRDRESRRDAATTAWYAAIDRCRS